MAADTSIPGEQIIDPATGQVWRVHPDWPKCRFITAEMAAAHNARTSDPDVLAKIKATAWTPADCNCEHCAQAEAMRPVVERWGRAAPYHCYESQPEMDAWMRAHKDATQTWPAAYWHRLYPCLGFAS